MLHSDQDHSQIFPTCTFKTSMWGKLQLFLNVSYTSSVPDDGDDDGTCFMELSSQWSGGKNNSKQMSS